LSNKCARPSKKNGSKNFSSIYLRGIFFLGNSDLEFIIEHCVNRHELELIREKPGSDIQPESWFTLYSEKYIPDKEETEPGEAFLQDVLPQKKH